MLIIIYTQSQINRSLKRSEDFKKAITAEFDIIELGPMKYNI